MLGMNGYSPQAYNGYSSSGYMTPEEIAMAQQGALQSGQVQIEALPSQSQAVAMQNQSPRYDATRLHNCYLAWEQAKSAENNEAFMASRYFHSKQWTDAEIRQLKRRK